MMWSNTLPAVFILVLCVAWMPVESSFFSHLVHHVEEEVHKAGHKLEDHVKDQIKDNLNHLEDKVEEKGGDLSQKLMDHVEQSLEKEGGSALAGLTGSLLNAFAGNQDANSNTVDDDTGDSTRALQGSLGSVAPNKFQDSGCQCVEYNCGCCAHAEVPKIHLNDTVCANVSYLPDQYGVSLVIMVDKYVIYNETISARNPPPICAGVPYLEKEASVCIDLYNLDVSNSTFSGCVKLEARLYGILIEDYDMGCFKMPLGNGRYRLENYQIRPLL